MKSFLYLSFIFSASALAQASENLAAPVVLNDTTVAGSVDGANEPSNVLTRSIDIVNTASKASAGSVEEANKVSDVPTRSVDRAKEVSKKSPGSVNAADKGPKPSPSSVDDANALPESPAVPDDTVNTVSEYSSGSINAVDKVSEDAGSAEPVNADSETTTVAASVLADSAEVLAEPIGTMTLGWIETVQLDSELGLKLEAKLDTGADSSSLDARNIRRVRVGEQSYVRFTINDPETGDEIELRKPYIRRVRIKRHGGNFQRRYVVNMSVCIGNHTRNIEVNLIDREYFDYPMLLGRSALQELAIVDPARVLTVEPSCWDKKERLVDFSAAIDPDEVPEHDDTHALPRPHKLQSADKISESELLENTGNGTIDDETMETIKDSAAGISPGQPKTLPAASDDIPGLKEVAGDIDPEPKAPAQTTSDKASVPDRVRAAPVEAVSVPDDIDSDDSETVQTIGVDMPDPADNAVFVIEETVELADDTAYSIRHEEPDPVPAIEVESPLPVNKLAIDTVSLNEPDVEQTIKKEKVKPQTDSIDDPERLDSVEVIDDDTIESVDETVDNISPDQSDAGTTADDIATATHDKRTDGASPAVPGPDSAMDENSEPAQQGETTIDDQTRTVVYPKDATKAQ